MLDINLVNHYRNIMSFRAMNLCRVLQHICDKAVGTELARREEILGLPTHSGSCIMENTSCQNIRQSSNSDYSSWAG